MDIFPIVLFLVLAFIFTRNGSDRKAAYWTATYYLRGGLRPKYKSALKKYSDYYSRLKPEYKKEFEKRLFFFMHSKAFIPRQMQHVPEELKVLISSKAIQITFGLPKVYLSHFQRILVYPNTYYSTINKQYHKGEVNPRHGIIVLSVDHFMTGIRDTTDGINLGLHEMAHALHLENRIKNEEYGFFNYAVWNDYVTLSHKEMEKAANSSSSLFRDYAYVDEFEFFAVMTELFFEQSERLRGYNPELYQAFAKLLQQDPLKLLIA